MCCEVPFDLCVNIIIIRMSHDIPVSVTSAVLIQLASLRPFNKRFDTRSEPICATIAQGDAEVLSEIVHVNRVLKPDVITNFRRT